MPARHSPMGYHLMVKVTGKGLKQVGGDIEGGFMSGSEFIKKQNIFLNIIYLDLHYYMQRSNVKYQY